MRGQIKHAFTFIIFMLVAAFVLFIGYRSISGIMGGACEADMISFTQDIESYFELYDDYGSVHTERLGLPCNYRYVCFVNASIEESDSLNVRNQPSGVDVAVLETAKETDNNIFLVGEFVEPIGYSEKIWVQGSETALCVEGPAELTFKGRGAYTMVEE